jgi:hypothetical protein
MSSLVSAKTGQNVRETFRKFIRKIIESKVDVIPLKDLYMNMLLCVNEDFDDDLLHDAMEMLVDI